MNTAMLKNRLETAGIKLHEVAERIGITRQGLHNKLSGHTEFKSSEIRALSEMLHLSADERDLIFFSDYVDNFANN